MTRLFSLILLLSSPIFAQAQFKNILLDPGTPGNQPTEPSIAIDLNDKTKIVAGSSLNNVYYTNNGGLSWQKSILTSPLGVWGKPAVIADFKGNFYYFHLSDPTGKNLISEETIDRIVVQESNDGGETWSEGIGIGLNQPKDQYKEYAVVDRKGNFFVTWTQFDKFRNDDPACESVVLLSTSSNGKKWSKPIQISLTPGDCKDDDNTAMSAVPAVTSDGSRVFVTWANQNKIFFDRSFDSGKTWLSNDIQIADHTGGWAMNIPGMNRCNGMPVLVCDNTKAGKMSDALYVVWADQRNGENDTDIWFIRSLNYGDNWTQPLRINSGEKGKHQFMPRIAVDPQTGHFYVIFYDRRNYSDSKTDVYIAYSTDYGASFKNVKISESPFEPSGDVPFGDYCNISASGGIITPIWTRMENGQTSIWTAIIKHEDLEKVK